MPVRWCASMNLRPKGLSDFESPPLTEVVLSQFEQIEGLRAPHNGLALVVSRTLASRREAPPLASVIEQPPRIAFGIEKSSVPRVWFLSVGCARFRRKVVGGHSETAACGGESVGPASACSMARQKLCRGLRAVVRFSSLAPFSGKVEGEAPSGLSE
jgi:hypothetical protein